VGGTASGNPLRDDQAPGGDAGDPFCGTRVSAVDGVKDEFDAIGNSQLVEDTEQVLLDGVLAEAEFAGDVAIAGAFGCQGNNLLISGRERSATIKGQRQPRGSGNGENTMDAKGSHNAAVFGQYC
jgi:hypothetical protein